MPTRPGADQRAPRDGADARQGGEWWGLDRDRLEDELAWREQTRAGEPVPH